MDAISTSDSGSTNCSRIPSYTSKPLAFTQVASYTTKIMFRVTISLDNMQIVGWLSINGAVDLLEKQMLERPGTPSLFAPLPDTVFDGIYDDEVGSRQRPS
ncbi:hypothetical protein AK830_g1985 [Neonectria ditissima]|uniref:Uncharacterized protein n=1 Tax=Neonectria ditissima TaxID=78410 RepID=A0A0P7BXB8_9HYPO|nr:hypothetical protein AK830_g1985 [Neonectria ditissima]